jgi:gamma-glutamylcyclotransferase (GGCT)/AIG2-like uncharacterized protein YtfP
MEKLFVYGTLKDPKIQMHLVGRTIQGQPAKLRGYRSHDILDYPTALPDPRGIVEGLVLTVTAEEIARFDEYEGNTYQRVRVTLESGEETWMYQGHPDVYGTLVNSPSSAD